MLMGIPFSDSSRLHGMLAVPGITPAENFPRNEWT